MLAAQDTDEFRLALAEKIASQSPASIPTDVLRDLTAGALARRDFNRAIQLLETEKEHGFRADKDFFLLTYLYCLKGSVEKAEALAAAKALRAKKIRLWTGSGGSCRRNTGFVRRANVPHALHR